MKRILNIALAITIACLEPSVAIKSYARQGDDRPNIVWIVCEDIGPYLRAYGYDGVKTPNIDQLAREGELYTKAYTTAGVCAPSRSALITGMYQTSIGAMHMRTLNANSPDNTPVPSYSAVIPPYVKCFPEYLRLAGYYTTNNEKQDYQFEAPVTVWDENSAAASWKNRAPKQPFFSVFNLAITHEMNLFVREDEPFTVDPKGVLVPPFYNQTETAAKAVARQLTNIEKMDTHVGEIIAKLKADGLYDDSWIMFYSDHGGALPWMKRELLERGTHIPFIVKYPKGQKAGSVNNNLISAVDFAPTVLSIAGVSIPNYMEGQAFLGKQKAEHSRQYIFAARDRVATRYDRVRAVSDGRFKYLYNYMPDLSYYQDLNYRKAIPLMKEILELHEKGQLNPLMSKWFGSKPQEELYDTETDPDEIKNLINDPDYVAKLQEMRAAFNTWSSVSGDMGSLSEKEMLALWWRGEDSAPQTAVPVVIRSESGIKLYCDTEGASMGYQIKKGGSSASALSHEILSYDFASMGGRAGKNGERYSSDRPWTVYSADNPITLSRGDTLTVKAMRIGFQESRLTYVEHGN